MGPKNIKSGAEVVCDFIISLRSLSGVDEQTAAIVEQLYRTGRLSKTRLLQELAEKRNELTEILEAAHK